jgi:hypothetical protein
VISVLDSNIGEASASHRTATPMSWPKERRNCEAPDAGGQENVVTLAARDEVYGRIGLPLVLLEPKVTGIVTTR